MALPEQSNNAASMVIGSKQAAAPLVAGYENGTVQGNDASGHGDAAAAQQTADLKAELASERQRHATELQHLREALQERDAALSSHTDKAGRTAEQLQAVLQAREDEIGQLHAQLKDLQSLADQQAAAASEWQSSKSRLEEQVCSPQHT